MSKSPRLLTFLVLSVLTACSSRVDSTPNPVEIDLTPSVSVPSLAEPSATRSATLKPVLTSTATADQGTTSGSVTLMAVGDIMLGRTVGEQVITEGPGVVFSGVQTILSLADILVGNLECTITDQGQPDSKSFTFAAPPVSAQALGMAGFDLINLGNNHTLDFGLQGLTQTQELLSGQGIASVGIGFSGQAAGPVVFEKNGLRIAFLSYVDVPEEISGFDARDWIASSTVPGIAWATLEEVKTGVAAAKQKADVVIVLMHFGFEGNELPVREQREDAVAAIDAGAAAVIGTHPHLLQHVEEYRGALIAYSLGNFVFDDFDMPENRSAILRLTVNRDGMVSYDWFPVIIKNGLPGMASPEQASEIYRMLAP